MRGAVTHNSFSALTDHLANLSAALAAAAAPIVQSSGPQKGVKRKALPGSRGVEALKKVNTTSMAKLTNFFKPKAEDTDAASKKSKKGK